jgi:hypothetical protein
MEQRDFILREIEKIGKMLLGIIGKLKAKKETKEFHHGLTLANQEFEEETGMSLEMLVQMDGANLEAFFRNHPELNSENQELLADLLIDIGEEISSEPSDYLRQAKVILEYIDKQGRTFSMERAGKLEYLDKKISSLPFKERG